MSTRPQMKPPQSVTVMKVALFSVFLLVFVVTAGVTLAGITKLVDIEERFLWALFSALLLELVAGVVTLFNSADFFGTRPPTELESAARTDSDALEARAGSLVRKVREGSTDLRSMLDEWQKWLEAAESHTNTTFLGTKDRQIRDIGKQLERMARGEVSVAPSDYSQILKDLCENTEQPVFCTNDAANREYWNSAHGREFLSIQAKRIQQSGIPMQRVFLFKTLSEVEDPDLEMMESHQSAGIDVWAYIDNLDDSFAFPRNMRPDFCVVGNGEVIGVTQKVSGGFGGADWDFSPSDDKRRKFNGYVNELSKAGPAKLSVEDLREKLCRIEEGGEGNSQ